MLKRYGSWLVVAAALMALAATITLFVRDAQTPPAPVALPLTQTFDDSPTGFTFQYPDGWDYAILARGILVAAPTATLSGEEPGPSLTVQRAEPLSVVGTIDAALERYVKNGPLRVEGRWSITSAAQAIPFEGREGRSVEVEGSDAASAPTLHTRIIVTAADNSIVYFFVTSVPQDKRDAYDLTLEAMLASVKILE